MRAQKIEVCPNCLDPRLGGNEERTWCMNTDCAYTWLTYERNWSAKIRDRIRKWWWINVDRPLLTLMWKIVFAVLRPFRRKGSAKK